MMGFDEARRTWIVAEQFTELANTDLEHSGADADRRPNGCQERIGGHYVARTFQ